MKLEAGQVAVVTGAANGIGRALATRLAKRGVRVVLADLDGETVRATADELGGRGVAVPTDVADEAQVRRLAEAAFDAFGRVDLVVNNAGTTIGGPSWLVDASDTGLVWSVNVGGVMNGIRVFVPRLIDAGGGHIVNTASIAGLTFGAFNAVYTASKHAIVSLSESLRSELAVLAPEIGVTVLCPGPVETPLLQELMDAVDLPDGHRNAKWLNELSADQRAQLAPTTEAIWQMLRVAVPPEQVAQAVIDAVEADRFYVSTHPDMATKLVRQRATALESGFIFPPQP